MNVFSQKFYSFDNCEQKERMFKRKEFIIMKKFLSIVMALTLILSLAACGQTSNNENTSISSDSTERLESTLDTDNPNTSEHKILVAYFSWSGNTEDMAAYIAEQTGGDLLEIQPSTPYPTDYNECGELALTERDNNERPEISNLPESIDEYDTILIGYPIWWHTAPMIIGSFLESYDLSGKEIYPFTQSASMDTEQFNNSIAFVRESAAGAAVHDGLFARPSNTEAIDEYLLTNALVR